MSLLTRPHPLMKKTRLLHAGAWWMWALGLAAAASRVSNPLLLAMILAVTAIAVTFRTADAPWVRAYSAAIRLGVLVLMIRLIFGILFGVEVPGTTIFSLPEVAVPDWAAGVRMGGSVTIEQVVFAFSDGLRLATIIVCIGAANALTGPTRLLKSVPGALYELGVAVVVAMSLAPQLVLDASRVRDARRLRGRTTRGAAGVVGLVGPVLDGSLRRSLDLAAAMDTRGYGRTAQVPRSVRRTTAALVLTGMIGVTIGIYGVLDGGSSPWVGLPMLGVGVVLGAAGLMLGGRRTMRTRYRPDRWLLAEWIVTCGGWAAAACVWVVASSVPAALEMSVTPLAWPALPLIPVVGIALAGIVVFAAPLPPPPSDDIAIDDEGGASAGAVRAPAPLLERPVAGVVA